MSESPTSDSIPQSSLARVRQLEDRLADLREERRLTLGQPNVHVDAWTVKRLQEDFAAEEARLLAELASARAGLP